MRRRRNAAASLLFRATHNLEDDAYAEEAGERRSCDRHQPLGWTRVDNLEEVRAADLAREEEARAAADEARREAEFQAHLEEIARTEGGGKLAPR